MNRVKTRTNGSADIRAINEFRKFFRGAQNQLLRYIKEEKIIVLRERAFNNYLQLLPKLPDIGGKKNGETGNLIVGACILSIALVCEEAFLSVPQIGKIIYSAYFYYFYSRPLWVRFLLGRMAQTKAFRRHMESQIQYNSARCHKEGFMMKSVDVPDQEYDFAYNYTKCALHYLFAKHSALSYLPYVCLGDFVLFKSLGIGFKRTRTIANGASYCDFRFKKGVCTSTGWPPEQLEEWTGDFSAAE